MDIEKSLEILGLKPDATLDEAKRAYKAQVKIWHPDRFSHDSILRPRAEENIRRVNIAYAQVRSYLMSKHKGISWQKLWPWVQPAARKSRENRLETATTFLLRARTDIQQELARLPLPDSVKRGGHFILKSVKSIIQWGAERLAKVGKGPWEKTRRFVQTLVGETIPHLFDFMKKRSFLVVKEGKALLHRWTEAFCRASGGAGEKGKDPSKAHKEATAWKPPREKPGEMQGKRMSRVNGMGQRTATRPARGGSAIDGIGGVGGPGRVERPSRVRGVGRI
ncbi:MAG: J domain-containing protein [Thermodesulfobacteriota bacterium]|nr:J domain-containing protein [Thermodesulfobacteriota bacterium]